MRALILTLLVLIANHSALAGTYDQRMNSTEENQVFSAEQIRSIQMKLYKANCFEIPAGVDPAPLCAPDHTWGLGGTGGFYCCQRPPT